MFFQKKFSTRRTEVSGRRFLGIFGTAYRLALLRCCASLPVTFSPSLRSCEVRLRFGIARTSSALHSPCTNFLLSKRFCQKKRPLRVGSNFASLVEVRLRLGNWNKFHFARLARTLSGAPARSHSSQAYGCSSGAYAYPRRDGQK